MSKPLIVAGNGIRLAGEQKRFRAAIDRWQIPFVTTWPGADLIPTDHPLNTGILGMMGQGGANKAVQECDYLLAIGTHLCYPQTTTLTDQFAPHAKIAVVNIDADQLANMNVRVDYRFCTNISSFFGGEFPILSGVDHWRTRCAALKKLNAIGNPRASSGINSYVFNDMMNRMLPEGTCMVIDGGGTALYTGFQSAYVKEGTRLICSTSVSAMGSGLPEAVGACLANARKLTTCLIGDGSFMLNVQELQTIFHHKLPIKIFVINNGGYLSVRNTQDAFLEGRRFGTGGAGDISWPRIEGIARAFAIPFLRLSVKEQAKSVICAAMNISGPVLCEVICPSDQEMRWKQAFKKEGDRFIPQTLDVMEESA